MTLAYLILSLIVLTVIGYSVMEIIFFKSREDIAFPAKIGLAYLLGMGSITVEFLIFSLVDIPLRMSTLLLPWIPFFISAVYCSVKKHRIISEDAGRGGRIDSKDKYRVIFRTFFAVLFVQTASVFLRAISKPIESYDGIINFAIKSKLFFLNDSVRVTPSLLEGIGKGHMDYPLLIPFSELWAYKFMGIHDCGLVKILFPLVFLAFLVSFYFLIKRFFNARYAFLFTFLLFTVPQIVNYGTIGYADLTFNFIVTVSFISLYSYFTTGNASMLLFSAILTGCGMLTKNEGIAFLFSSLAIIGLFVLKEGNKRRQIQRILIAYIIPLVLLLGPWLLFKRELNVENTDIEFSAFTLSKLKDNISQIPFILNKFQQEVFGPKKWNILWVLIISAAALTCRRKKTFGVRLTGYFILFNILIYFASYMLLTGKDLYFHVNTTLSRFMIHFSGVSVFYVACVFWDDARELEIFK